MGFEAQSTAKAIRPQPASALTGRFVALYDLRFVLHATSEGIRDFFAFWPEIADDEADVPACITAFVRAQWSRCRADGEVDRAGLFLPDLLMYVTEVYGMGGALVAATFSSFAVRDPVRAAARRFHLTPRETEVVKLLLRGMRASEIARRLGLSEMTVGDYFKSLRLKTESRTQSGMIAMFLGWGTPGSPRRFDPEHAR